MMTTLVGLGGMFGAMTRFYLGKLISSKTSNGYPYATFIINISGCFFLGLLNNFYMNKEITDWIWLTFGVGFLGAYTTFSTFGYETIQLIEKKKYQYALIYVLLSVILGFLAAWFGMIIR